MITLLYLIPNPRTGAASSCEKGDYCVSGVRWEILTKSISTLLKSDQWLSESQNVSLQMRGAINFRNIPGTNIYALGQPTVEAIDLVIDHIKHAHPEAERIAWVMLREEPIVYVNGAPYCLRRERSSLRNMKGRPFFLNFLKFLTVWADYGGISAERLEILEERLRDDVVSELHSFGGKYAQPFLSHRLIDNAGLLDSSCIPRPLMDQ